jgi:hypothetical protein
LRTPEDTRGHGVTPVRDREAPGSNPGPPTSFEFSLVNRFFTSPAAGHNRVTPVSQILEKLGAAGPLEGDSRSPFELAHCYLGRRYISGRTALGP